MPEIMPSLNLGTCLYRREMYNLIVSYLLFGILTMSLNELIKNLYGKPRPDYFSRCFPCAAQNSLAAENVTRFLQEEKIRQNFNGLQPWTCQTLDFIQENNCTSHDNYFCDSKCQATGRRSLPSGHSMTIWYICFYASLFTAGNFKVFSKTGDYKNWQDIGTRFMLLCDPIFVAFFVCLTRMSDYRHFPTDVLAGSLIGILGSSLGYFLFFPKLTREDCFLSYSGVRLVKDYRANDCGCPAIPEETGTKDSKTDLVAEAETVKEIPTREDTPEIEA